MRWLISALACAGLVLSVPAFAQSNNDDYTPLNSRIKRDRQFPTTLFPRFPEKMSKANRDRSKAMIGQFSRCIYNRSNEKSLDLLGKTDFGFVAFEQLDMETSRVARIYGFQDCLSRVAQSRNSGLMMRFTAGGLRQWLLEQAYFDRYPDSPDWIQPGLVVADRIYPLSESNFAVHTAMDFADCVVIADPYNADYFFRTPAGSTEERDAINELVPSLGACLPQGQQMEIQPEALRLWLGEGLWHASNNSAPAEVTTSEVTQ